ncbi:MAG: 3-hydroxyacyl-CoA dehydrogenase/enoyl-CoA hydratase family protein [Candidatus Marinimicrobia bacterium]|jgi:enoyl-CoA hydratase/3-hydroxyacyl-CoA dehydrogenase|nr:3-hydroxyacyl-CoA dehydrogenase/enoyl-CoA hydratase family protein [Candidatus Neomarinimicrobiota bacterium]MDP6569031.1 3-hydroxyacyl-CoA dehydrogenase/enoyl-CoA hydratase family protein [Candidatus Neomarinimicrobiota bacterium]MDP7025658.1 3-hydroxyacyl-CoA dehydrogenase/enoyl-CoA hydratase family protein [Candidatus Neomarinimicrobiota bacterium]|tara:strand:- start:772 stop:2790 length:2019 start_codon:yes stop_codon:yes gene_type:complete
MSYSFKNYSISKLSVIGAGQIGPDICLHFSKVFSNHDVELILVDIVESALESARSRIEKKIHKGVETGAFSPAMAEEMMNSITYTTDYQAIGGSDIVLEAATEDEKVKNIIFNQVEEICSDNCLFLSNSSHMRPEEIFKNISDKSRCLVTHYFFPAERNPVVEIVPGKETISTITELLMGFYEDIGKVPIKVKSSYGYAIDPIFEGLCQTAIICLEKGLGNVKEIDAVAQKTLGLGVGPFTALTLTGGNPITNHGLDEMTDKLMSWFGSPKALQNAVQNNISWEIAKRGEKVELSQEKESVLEKQFLGAYFALSSFILDLDICTIHDLNMACEIALVVKPPFDMMNEIGLSQAHKIVEDFCSEHPEFPIPDSLIRAKALGKWEVSNIMKTVKDQVSVFTIRRPKVLNALNLDVIGELKSAFEEVENDDSIVGSVLTGFGVKAFVSGADINMLASLKTPEEAYENARYFQEVLSRIQHLKKPVVCAMNGFAFGGGNELAMSCTARICGKGVRVLACQPEVNLGFIPGAGATQRLPRLVGIDTASEILRTGRPVSSKEAVKIGLVHREVESNLIEEAVTFVREIADGSVEISPMTEMPISDSGDIPEVDIGHLSRKIDTIITETIYEGAGMSLEDGLDFEARQFGRCMKTEDMKIGLKNFLTNGPRVKAKFVHK